MKNEKIEELVIDEWIWIVFIILSALNISGDELEKKCYMTNDLTKDEQAKKIFTFTVIVSFFIYLYLAKRNYHHVERLRNNHQDSSLAEVRLLGSILIEIGVFLLLYFQLNSSSSNNPSVA